MACPRDVEREGRRAPEHLAPTRGAEADGEDGQQPRVRFAEVGEDADEDGPDDDEEQNDKQRCLPAGDVDVPQEAPVASVRLGYAYISKLKASVK